MRLGVVSVNVPNDHLVRVAIGAELAKRERYLSPSFVLHEFDPGKRRVAVMNAENFVLTPVHMFDTQRVYIV